MAKGVDNFWNLDDSEGEGSSGKIWNFGLCCFTYSITWKTTPDRHLATLMRSSNSEFNCSHFLNSQTSQSFILQARINPYISLAFCFQTRVQTKSIMAPTPTLQEFAHKFIQALETLGMIALRPPECVQQIYPASMEYLPIDNAAYFASCISLLALARTSNPPISTHSHSPLSKEAVSST